MATRPPGTRRSTSIASWGIGRAGTRPRVTRPGYRWRSQPTPGTGSTLGRRTRGRVKGHVSCPAVQRAAPGYGIPTIVDIDTVGSTGRRTGQIGHVERHRRTHAKARALMFELAQGMDADVSNALGNSTLCPDDCLFRRVLPRPPSSRASPVPPIASVSTITASAGTRGRPCTDRCQTNADCTASFETGVCSPKGDCYPADGAGSGTGGSGTGGSGTGGSGGCIAAGSYPCSGLGCVNAIGCPSLMFCQMAGTTNTTCADGSLVCGTTPQYCPR